MFTQEFSLVVWLRVRPENEPKKTWSVPIFLGLSDRPKKIRSSATSPPPLYYISAVSLPFKHAKPSVFLEAQHAFIKAKCSYETSSFLNQAKGQFVDQTLVKWSHNPLTIRNSALSSDVTWGRWSPFLIDASNKHGDLGGGGHDVCSVDVEVRDLFVLTKELVTDRLVSS